MKLRLATALALLVPLSLGSLQCVSSKKTSKEQQAQLSKYIKTEAPSDIKKLGVEYEDKLTLVGYKINTKGRIRPGQKIEYTLYWKSNKEIGKPGWKLYTHVLDEKHRRVLNIDAVGPIRNYTKKKQALPPSDWKPGKVYVDEQSFTVPKSFDGSTLKIVTGVWKGKQRLKIKKGPNIGENRGLVAVLAMQGKSEEKKKPEPKVPELRVDRLEKGMKIKIDGKLDEQAWKDATSTGAFVSVRNGKPDPKYPVQGSAKVAWDEQAVYFAFEVTDPDVVGGFQPGEKDPHLWTKDTVEIMLDPDGDGDNKDYYEIQVNPQNLVFDSRFDAYNKPRGGAKGPFGHEEWTSKIESAVVVDGTIDNSKDRDKGYVVEVKLPWKSLDKAKQVPPEVGQSWRVNFYAMQNNGGVAWSPILGKGNFHKASRFGRITWAEKGWEPPKPAASQATPEMKMKEAAATLERGKPTAVQAPTSKAPTKQEAPKPKAVKPPTQPKAPTQPKVPTPPTPPKAPAAPPQ